MRPTETGYFIIYFIAFNISPIHQTKPNRSIKSQLTNGKEKQPRQTMVCLGHKRMWMSRKLWSNYGGGSGGANGDGGGSINSSICWASINPMSFSNGRGKLWMCVYAIHFHCHLKLLALYSGNVKGFQWFVYWLRRHALYR